MNRRLLLAVLGIVALGALAGCSAAGSLRMIPVNETSLAAHASQSTTGEFSSGAIYRERAAEIIENGSGTLLGDDPPIDTELPFEHEGEYYNLSYEVVGRVSGAVTLVSVDYNESSPNGTRVRFAALSSADKRELEPVLSESPPDYDDGYEISHLLTYTDAERAESVLATHAGGYVTVVYRGRSYEVEVRPMQNRTLERYRYEATHIAASAQAYARQLKKQYAFTLSTSNESERKILRKAIEDGYYADSTDDDAFASLVERFRSHEAVTADEYSGQWVVRYQGRLYWAEMDYGAFVQDGGESVTPPSVTPN